MHTSTVEAAGARIRVIEIGDGAPVLFIHGLGGWAETWAEVMPAVAASGRRAIAFDLPGFGASSGVPNARYFDPPRPLYAEVVEDVCRALGLVRPHLVGHSIGGAAAAVAAIVRPDAYRSLTIVAPGGLGTDIPLFLRLMSLPVPEAVARRMRPASVGRAVLRSCFFDPSRIPAHLWAEERRYSAAYGESLRVMRAVATLRGARPALRSVWAARAAAYRGPTLIVAGRQDGILPSAHVGAVAAAFTSAEVVLIDRAGHLVMAEQPEEFVRALLPFLAGAERADGGPRTMASGVAHQER